MHNRTNGRDDYRFLSADSVLAAFSSSPVDSGWLPEGVMRCGSTKRGNFVAQVIKSSRTTINIETKRNTVRRLELHLPAFLWFGYSTTWRIYALKTDSPNPNTEIFTAPLPNIMDTGVCWGSNNVAPEASVSNVRAAWQLFLDAPFSSSNTANRSKSFPKDVREFLYDLAKTKRSFPLDDLLPVKSGVKTIRDIVNFHDARE